ncbi:sterol desaturase family protein [Pontibacter sp. SGAir0037]|uniref:sterol desaturase family protein n=1 Tax=Pontibacter sp. SGAir0037 TaxID=2571030 RepID=UPI0010CCCF6E|nr:sterol desaturase family protein [Pontibacter sp. SGAir0037]QCR24157.1 hypothetical protein C1N53_18535 [Pontibacter sp. SGAir0037]
MRFTFSKFDKLGAPLLFASAVALFVLERKWQLRKRVRPEGERLLRNGGIAATALPALRLLLLPGMYAAAHWSGRHKAGLLHWFRLPDWLRYSFGFFLIDYSSYLWHVLLHKSDLLWRFHNVHHIDLDLDLSTAWRFHVGENIASVPIRGGMVALLGVPAKLVVGYEVLFEACTAFHHSNMRLPFGFERYLCRLLVTPRMHGIHHSIVAQETNSNFSVVLSCWDKLHNTLRLNVPQDAVTIGVPAYRNPQEQTLLKLLALPFGKQHGWQLPDGSVPERETSAGDEGKLSR